MCDKDAVKTKDWPFNLQKLSPPLELTHVRGMGGGPGGGLMIVVEYVSGGSNTCQNSSGDQNTTSAEGRNITLSLIP